jgi:hypothetical protein
LTQINAGDSAFGLSGHHDWRRTVLPQETPGDQDLITLALETMRVADNVPDTAIRFRLLEIADDLLRLARVSELPS